MKKIFSPIIKLIFSISAIFITGFLSSCLVVQISDKSGKINWNLITKSSSFYIIVIFIIVYVVLNIKATQYEINYKNKLDKCFYGEFLKNEGIVELARQANEAVKNTDKKKLKDVMDIKNMLEGEMK